ncbi:MAG: 30S ribosomal protein S24e [Candidatus Lokiarchaeota archaeon]|nr:30S ribosomal protein S24e [Candidatus Lokiarchaeota archaeon]
MSFEIEIVEEKKNLLIERTEVKFRIEHFGSGTPNRLEIKKKIAALKNANELLTIVHKIQTHYGSTHDIGVVYIYDNIKELQFFEPFHIQVRNLPLEKRNEIYQAKAKKEPYKHLFGYTE